MKMRKILVVLLTILLLAACVPPGIMTVSAADLSDLTYEINEVDIGKYEVTITGCSESAEGVL